MSMPGANAIVFGPLPATRMLTGATRLPFAGITASAKGPAPETLPRLALSTVGAAPVAMLAKLASPRNCNHAALPIRGRLNAAQPRLTRYDDLPRKSVLRRVAAAVECRPLSRYAAARQFPPCAGSALASSSVKMVVAHGVAGVEVPKRAASVTPPTMLYEESPLAHAGDSSNRGRIVALDQHQVEIQLGRDQVPHEGTV